MVAADQPRKIIGSATSSPTAYLVYDHEMELAQEPFLRVCRQIPINRVELKVKIKINVNICL
jgi:hypothetical protein